MTHETFHELIALRLYGELAPEEAGRLDEHLATCAACRTVASELEETLGAVRAADHARDAGALPAGWRERLDGLVRAAPRRSRLPSLVPFAAGLAAGLLLMLSWTGSAGPPPPAGPASSTGEPELSPATAPISIARSARQAPFSDRAAPPPRTTSRGPLEHLPELLDR